MAILAAGKTMCTGSIQVHMILTHTTAMDTNKSVIIPVIATMQTLCLDGVLLRLYSGGFGGFVSLVVLSDAALLEEEDMWPLKTLIPQ